MNIITTVQDKTRGYLKSDFRGINKYNANQYHKRKSDRKYNTIFGQLLGLVSRSEFDLTSTVGEKLSKQMSADKYSKGFTAWTHFCSMVFAQVSRQHGLRSIENALNQQSRNFYHLGIKSADIKRSTLSYANNNRSADFFQALFYRLLNSQNNVKEKQFPSNNQFSAGQSLINSLIEDYHDAIQKAQTFDEAQQILISKYKKHAKLRENFAQVLDNIRFFASQIGADSSKSR